MAIQSPTNVWLHHPTRLQICVGRGRREMGEARHAPLTGGGGQHPRSRRSLAGKGERRMFDEESRTVKIELDGRPTGDGRHMSTDINYKKEIQEKSAYQQNLLITDQGNRRIAIKEINRHQPLLMLMTDGQLQDREREMNSGDADHIWSIDVRLTRRCRSTSPIL